MQSEMTRSFDGTGNTNPVDKNESTPGMRERPSRENQAIALKRKELDLILEQSIQLTHRVNLDACKNQVPFRESAEYAALKSSLDAIRTPLAPKPGLTPPEPEYVQPKVSLGQMLVFKKKSILQAAEEAHARKMESWQQFVEKRERTHAQQMKQYEDRLAEAEAERHAIREKMEEAAVRYEADRARHNESMEMLRINYRSMKPAAVEEFLAIGLQQNRPPLPFIPHFDLEYHRENHILFLSMELPHPGTFPKQKDLSIDPSTKQQRITEYTPDEREAQYNGACFQYILRVLHEVFALDEERVVEAVQLQAWVLDLNKGNGQMEKTCIATLYARAADVQKINFAQVEPARCFQYLMGISAPSLAQLLPVPAQFADVQKTMDPPAKDRIDPLDESKNLASMPWSEAEKLLTDLFCKEFGQWEGGLDVLQSSPEQGLDAVGTDANLLRGGRVLFMVRRSNKPLSISVVRELFGMVIHEGATKGILVTTADFTPEAYAFAHQKPITLVNGNGLLSLFEQHGQRFRINLREAVSLASLLS